MSEAPCLAAEGLAVGHGAATVAAGVDLALRPGTVTCLLGPNGVGKTTLFRTLLGLLPPRAGRVRLGGQDLSDLSRAEIARRVSYVPQAHAGTFAYTVLDLVVMGRTASLGAFASPRRADLRAARAALDRLGIAALGERDATRISGGQLQLALVARALAQGAGAVVMDEPTASLDLGNRLRVLEVVRGLAAEGLALLVSTHEPEQALALADQAAVIEPGGRFEVGPPDRLLTAERLSRLYGVGLVVETTPSGRRVVGPRDAPMRPGPSREPSAGRHVGAPTGTRAADPALRPSSSGNGSAARVSAGTLAGERRTGEDAMAEDRDEAETAGQRADPVAAKGEDRAQAGGPRAGEPAAAGSAYASGGPKGTGAAAPSGSRTEGSGTAPSNAAAPPVHTAMDREVREAEEKARTVTRP